MRAEIIFKYGKESLRFFTPDEGMAYYVLPELGELLAKTSYLSEVKDHLISLGWDLCYQGLYSESFRFGETHSDLDYGYFIDLRSKLLEVYHSPSRGSFLDLRFSHKITAVSDLGSYGDGLLGRKYSKAVEGGLEVLRGLGYSALGSRGGWEMAS